MRSILFFLSVLCLNLLFPLASSDDSSSKSKSCPTGCAACTNTGESVKCTACVGQGTLKQNTCLAPICSPTAYVNANWTCKACPTNCSTCFLSGSNVSCTGCVKGAFFNSTTYSCNPIPVCSPGTYYNATDNTCDFCPMNCTQCDVQNSKVKCYACASNAWYNSAQQKCEPILSCAQGTYYKVENNKCLNCPGQCAACIGPNTCTACTANFWFNPQKNSCDPKAVCKGANYFNYLNNSCQLCPKNCSSCQMVNDVVMCTACNSNFWLNNGTKFCDPNVVCQGPFYANLSDNKCYNCPANCSSCAFDGTTIKCTVCTNNTWFNASTQRCDSIPFCSSSNYYNETNNSCNGCPANCSACRMNGENVICSACNTGFWYDGLPGSCDPITVCDTSNYYNFSDNTCSQCPANCTACNINQNGIVACSACSTSTWLNTTAGSCDTVTECRGSSYYNNTDNNCNICPTNCSACNLNSFGSIECSSCVVDAWFNDLTMNCDGVPVCSGASYYNISNNSCQSCATNCSACFSSSNNCSTCVDGAFFNSTSNTCNPIPVCQGANYYNSTENICNECPANCTSCQTTEGNLICTACDVPAWFNSVKGSCEGVPVCDSTNYYNISDNTCNVCPTNCTQCSIIEQGVACSACEMAFWLNNISQSCESVSFCLSDQYYNFTDNSCTNCPLNCSSCAANSNWTEVLCSACLGNAWFNDSANNCEGIPICDSNAYYNFSDNSCNVCPMNCTACHADSSWSSMVCITCNSVSWFDNVKSTCDGVPICDSTNYYNITDNTCNICPINCTSCGMSSNLSSLLCLTCENNSWFNSMTHLCDAVPSCESTQFYNLTDNTCENCSKNCSTCNAIGCESCDSTHWFDAATLTCENINFCDINTYYNFTDNTCNNCPNNCSSCNASSDWSYVYCNGCNSKTWFNATTLTCNGLPLCDSNAYYNFTDNSCNKCPENCSTCKTSSDWSSILCQSCDSVAWFDASAHECEAVPSCDNGSYYNFTDNSCNSCPSNCSTCNLTSDWSSVLCQNCNSGFWLDVSIFTCDVVPSCSEGSYYNFTDNTCNNCPNNCTSCSASSDWSSVLCDSCASAAWYNAATKTCNGVPVCDSGFYYNLTDNTCNNCPANCSNCNASFDWFSVLCENCVAGAWFDAATLKCDAVPFCDSTGYYNLTDNTCNNCPENCTTCNASSDLTSIFCKSCDSSAWFDAASLSCEGVPVCGSSSYYNFTDNSCNQCPMNCSTCNPNTDWTSVLCQSCDLNHFLNVSTLSCEGVPICDSNSYYNLTDNTCSNCPTNCTSCNTSSDWSVILCDSCVSAAWYDTASKSCDGVPICNSGFFYNFTDNSCNKCPVNCSTCKATSDWSFVLCQSCDSAAWFDSSAQTCDSVPYCDSKGYYNSTDNTCNNCPTNCTACNASSDWSSVHCYSCDTAAWFDVATLTCDGVPSCGVGSYYNFTKNICIDCPINCTACNASDDGSFVFCQSCDSSSWFDAAAKTCDGVPLCSLATYYNLTDNTCNDCPSNCTSCNSSSDWSFVYCQTCDSHSWFDAATLTCDGVPLCDSISYYNFTDNSCNKCPVNCSTCKASSDWSSVLCQTCDLAAWFDSLTQTCDPVLSCDFSEYYNFTDNTCNNCPTNCTTCNASSDWSSILCNSCETAAWFDAVNFACDAVHSCDSNQYYNFTDNTCNICPLNCTTCKASADWLSIYCQSCDSVAWFDSTSQSCDGVPSCLVGSYYNFTDNSCKNCPTNCTSCKASSDWSSVLCSSCVSGAWYDAFAKTCDSVPFCDFSAYYNFSDNTCNKCPVNCSTCQASTDLNNVLCLSCDFDSWFNSSEQSCKGVPACDSNSYYNLTDNTCNICPVNCSSCNASADWSTILCSSCDLWAWFEFSTNSCKGIPVCEFNAYYNKSDNSCNNCPINCTTCNMTQDSSTINCLSCVASAWFDNVANVCEGIPVCGSNDYYNKSDNTCKECPFNCTVCTINNDLNSIECATCNSFAWFNYVAQTCDGIPFCDSSAYYNISDNTCNHCPSNCSVCTMEDSNSINCSVCVIEAWFNAVSHTCEGVPACDSTTFYNFSDNTCNFCPNRCLQCSLSTESVLSCQACSADAWLNAETGFCDTLAVCQNGSYYNDTTNTCPTCPTNCTLCYYDAQNYWNNNVSCTQCVAGVFFHQSHGECDPMPICGSHDYYNNTDNICGGCPTNCSSCHLNPVGGILCDSCFEWAWFDASLAICDPKPFCSANNFYNITDNICGACPSNCSVCSINENNMLDCSACVQGSWFNAAADRCDPVPADCGEAKYYNGTDNTCESCPVNCTFCFMDPQNIENGYLNCSSCKSGAFMDLQKGSCDGVPVCDSTMYYNGSDNTCNGCPSNCSNCIWDLNNLLNGEVTCNTCAKDFFQNTIKGSCDPVPLCSENDYYNSTENTCNGCPEFCEMCSYNATLNEGVICSSCKTNGWFNPLNQICDQKAICPKASYYNISENTCPSCPEFCSECSINLLNVITCSKCTDSGWYNIDEHSCNEKAICTRGTYFNNTANTCFFCPIHCSDCQYDETNTLMNNISCSACKGDTFFNVSVKYCQLRSICHEGTYYNSAENWCYDCPENCTDCVYNQFNTWNQNVTCLSCEDDSFFNSDLQSCDPVPFCEGPTYYNETDNQCHMCPDHCTNCSLNSSDTPHNGVSCYSCDETSWFNPKKESCSFRAHCQGNTYYNSSEDTCLFCPYYCTECNYDDTNPGNHNITCVACRNDGWLAASLNCEMKSKCRSGSYYNINDNSCYDCPDDCSECVYDVHNADNVTCTACEDVWHYALNAAGRCISKHD